MFSFHLGSKKSKMFDEAPLNVMNILKTEDVTSNQHIFCVTQQVSEYDL